MRRTQFENSFTGAKYCITCANGTDALQVAIIALVVGPVDEFITPGFSYIATADSARLLETTPVLATLIPPPIVLSPISWTRPIMSRTPAITPVLLHGQPADFDHINEVASAHGLPVIEDRVRSFGGSLHGRRSGNSSKI
ncbi:DegT/DnrJ/EryC1/StrS family aminotransferase [Ruegeria conchae]|uniref:DegT/DnrJ/EryC1/StrS family aminotransferase n=1 Tax=Ruegeria conchae TaxID=981384 RepID=UPI0021A587BC|nr:DegT/DnrJ/EryC1/StrS family aminotransferase [Ruegeria conchae]